MAFRFSPPSQPAASATEPALALLELQSVARGFVATDAAAKKAPVRICRAHAISPGHFIVLFTGGVAEVEESLAEGMAAAGPHLLAHLLLPQVHPKVSLAVDGRCDPWPTAQDDPALAIIETFTVAAALLGADAACKTAPVQLSEMRLGQGLGGKAYFVLLGEQYDVEAAAEAAEEAATTALVQRRELIARPHPDFLDYLRLPRD